MAGLTQQFLLLGGSNGFASGCLSWWKPDVVQIDRGIVPGKFLQEFCSGCGIGGNLLDQALDIILLPLDESQQADVLLVAQKLMEQTIAIVSRRLRSTASGRRSGLWRLTTAQNAND